MEKLEFNFFVVDPDHVLHFKPKGGNISSVSWGLYCYKGEKLQH